MQTQPIRVYADDYRVLVQIKNQLSKLWRREATFADAIRHLIESQKADRD